MYLFHSVVYSLYWHHFITIRYTSRGRSIVLIWSSSLLCTCQVHYIPGASAPDSGVRSRCGLRVGPLSVHEEADRYCSFPVQASLEDVDCVWVYDLLLETVLPIDNTFRKGRTPQVQTTSIRHNLSWVTSGSRVGIQSKYTLETGYWPSFLHSKYFQ